MYALKKLINFFRIFSKNLTFITVGSIFIHFIVMIINIYASKTGRIEFNTELFNVIFSGSMYPVVMAYGILIFITLSLFQKLNETEAQLKNERQEKEKYKEALNKMQKISGFVLQETSQSNNEILRWLQKKQKNGTAPETVKQASVRIGKALESLSYSFFVMPYTDKHTSISAAGQYKQIE